MFPCLASLCCARPAHTFLRALQWSCHATALQDSLLLVCAQVSAKLVVLNLSQQTDSSDLLGGFRPVEARHSMAPLLPAFFSLVQRTWARGRNQDYLSRVSKAAQRGRWGVVSKAVAAAVQKVG